MKMPWMQFCVMDWLSDPDLSRCHAVTRGIWADFLCAMHINGRSGQITGTSEELARIGRCTPAEIEQALVEIRTTNTGEVIKREVPGSNGNVTVIYTVCNRRMKREAKAREQTRKRVAEHRSNASVTPYARARASDLRLKSESESDTKLKNKSDKGDKALAKLTEAQGWLAAVFEKALGNQWANDSGKWINRIKANHGKCERVIAEIRSAMIESRIKTTVAQYAEQIWKEFA